LVARVWDRLGEVLEDADEDLFLRLEVVVERRFGDLQALGDLAQGGLLVALLREEFEGHVLDAPAGVPAAPLPGAVHGAAHPPTPPAFHKTYLTTG
jgi:hypothetical protein